MNRKTIEKYANHMQILLFISITYLSFVYEAEQIWHIDKHVVISLKNVLWLIAVIVNPLQRCHSLQRQVIIRVHETRHNQIIVKMFLQINSQIHDKHVYICKYSE